MSLLFSRFIDYYDQIDICKLTLNYYPITDKQDHLSCRREYDGFSAAE